MESSYIIKELKTIDPAFEQYLAFVLATWLRSLQHGSEFFGMIDPKVFYEVYRKTVLALLKRHECTARLAVLSDDHDTVIGWSVFEGKVLHFVYVRPGERDARGRKQRIGTNLLPKSFDTVTHMTRIGRSIWRSKYPEAKFNPF